MPTQTTLGSGPSPYWSTWTTDTLGKTSSRTDKTATTSSTTAYTHPANGATAVRPHSVTKTVTTGTGAATRDYTYDAAGNTLTRPGPTGSTQTLSYDDEGKLTQVATGATINSVMVYDPAGNRLIKKEGDVTTLSVAGTELAFNNSTSVAEASRYYTHLGGTVAIRTGNSADKLLSVVTDHQGTAHHQIRNDTSAVSTSWQNPYGATRGTIPAGWAGEKAFVGGTKDVTGLIHIGARDYDPVLQRFATVDPILVLGDPLQWNAYTYGENSPVTFSDPSGLISVDGGGRGGPPASPLYPVGSSSKSAKSAKSLKQVTKRWPKKQTRTSKSSSSGSSRSVASSSGRRDWSPPANRAPAPDAPQFEWPDPSKLLQGVDWREVGHVALDLAGLIPGIGEIADGINALWYAAEGDWTNAALSAAGMIPGLGAAVITAKYAAKYGGKVADKAVSATANATRIADGPDHIALGFDRYVRDFAHQIGARHLMDLPNGVWQRELLDAIADGTTRISVYAKDFDDLMDMMRRGRYLDAGNRWARVGNRNPSATDWEMWKLSEAGWPRVTLYREDGSIDPFLPLLK